MYITNNNLKIDTRSKVSDPNEEDVGAYTPVLFTGIAITGLFFVGKAIATYTFFGLLTLGSFMTLTESIPPIKRVVRKNKHTVDVLLFGATGYVILTAGVTVAATLVVASLGYTMWYKPMLLNK